MDVVNTKTIKCRFCGWQTLRFRRLKSGRLRGPENAYAELLRHIEYAHKDQWQEIESYLESLYSEVETIENLPRFD